MREINPMRKREKESRISDFGLSIFFVVVFGFISVKVGINWLWISKSSG